MATDLRALVHAPVLVPSPLERYRAEAGRRALYDDGGLVLASIGGTELGDNAAIVLSDLAPERVFALADRFFGSVGYSVVVEVESAAPMEQALRARHWRLDEEEPALVLAPLPPSLSPPLPAGLTIRPVTTEADLADFMQIAKTGQRWIPSLAAAVDPAVALFVGYVEQAPVATSRLTCCGQVGDINGVVTAESHRRRGFGTALTWAAIAEGARRGCTAMTLTATELGYGLYVRMGFIPVCTYRTYLPPGA